MYSTCLFCVSRLGSNEAIERFPVGRRLAFDSALGRLWVVCSGCGRWNLSPIEERWEAIEECERRFEGARLRYSTGNIALAHLREGTDLVRIGKPLRPEFAAWRYGRRFSERARKARILDGLLCAGHAGMCGVVIVAGLPSILMGLVLLPLPFLLKGISRDPLTATIEVRSLGIVPRMRGIAVGSPLYLWASIQSSPETAPGWELEVVLGADRDREYREVHRLQGSDAVRAVSRVLTTLNQWGGSRRDVQSSVKELAQVPHPGEYIRLAASRFEATRPSNPLTWETPRPGFHETDISMYHPVMRLALEMALHEDSEARALAGELDELEKQWREAEEVASIADRLLVPEAVDARLRRMKTGEPHEAAPTDEPLPLPGVSGGRSEPPRRLPRCD
jgi:hypothetical protein